MFNKDIIKIINSVLTDYYLLLIKNKYIFSFIITSILLFVFTISVEEILNICMFINYWILIFNVVITYEDFNKLLYDITSQIMKICIFLLFILIFHLNYTQNSILDLQNNF